MSNIFVLALLGSILLYIIIGVVMLEKKLEQKRIADSIQANVINAGMVNVGSGTEGKVSAIRTMAWEDAVLKKFNIKPSEALFFLYVERIILIVALVAVTVLLKGLGLAAVLAVLISLIFSDMNKKMIYNSGITNIPYIVSFINFFVPQINSGVSADQALARFIETNADEDLAEYYKNRDNADYKMPVHLKQVVDVYQLAIYNENLGMNDYTYILMEMSEDINQKSTYYNKFMGAIGEIKPTGYAFSFGVPILIAASYTQTADFWQGGFGWLAAFAIVALYATYKFLVYKLQEKTINKIF